ncbi:MAG: 4Fe-4S single cluster domain-containing protein [Anaerolineaceae bacterium]
MNTRNFESQNALWSQMQSGESLNIAAICPGTNALGPGWRAVVWVQGCALRCRGCIAADWWEFKPANIWNPESLAKHILVDPTITGLTLSGGEPMQQAAGLCKLIDAARSIRPINVIAYSGYLLSQLQAPGAPEAIQGLIERLDVLIDSPYRIQLDDDQGLRGSSNQTIHFLTDTLKDSDFITGPRRAEIYVQGDSFLVAGIPSKAITPNVERAIRGWVTKEVQHERL